MADDLPPDAVPIRQLVDEPDADGHGPGENGPDENGPDGDSSDGNRSGDHGAGDDGGGSRPPAAPLIGLVALLAVMIGVGGVLVYQRASTPGAGSVDVGFMQDMTTHHQQAVEMASIVAEQGQDPDIRAFAREILTFQQYEVGYMEALLEDWGQWPFPADRTAMTWMDMSSAPADMPGMQSQAKMDALEKATGSDVDELFIPMMIDHHKGGIHMAEYAAKHASDPRVRDLAERIVQQQTGEIGDFERAAKRLGVQL